jgi:hypothetical protein
MLTRLTTASLHFWSQLNLVMPLIYLYYFTLYSNIDFLLQ